MKHILNNLTDEEKNSIRNQHTGSLKVNTDKFSKLVNSKVGDVKPIVKEQITGNTMSTVVMTCFKSHFNNPDMEIPKSCQDLAKEIIDTKKIPSDAGKITACSADLSKSTGNSIFTTMGMLKDVGECIIKKVSSPVKI